jgi:hypothetical protein
MKSEDERVKQARIFSRGGAAVPDPESASGSALSLVIRQCSWRVSVMKYVSHTVRNSVEYTRSMPKLNVNTSLKDNEVNGSIVVPKKWLSPLLTQVRRAGEPETQYGKRGLRVSTLGGT